MSNWNKDITVNVYSDDAAPAVPRWMYVVFTLEHRAYSIADAQAIADRLVEDGAKDVACVRIDCGEPSEDPLYGFPFLKDIQ